MVEVKYDANKIVTLMEVTNAFIDYVTDANLTMSEHLLVQNVCENVIKRLSSDIDD